MTASLEMRAYHVFVLSVIYRKILGKVITSTGVVLMVGRLEDRTKRYRKHEQIPDGTLYIHLMMIVKLKG